MGSTPLRLALAQYNFTVGDIRRNTQLIIEAATTALEQHRADLVIFPELAITGYPPDDLLLRPALHRQVQDAIELICRRAGNIDILLGLPEQADGRLYNSAFLIAGGKVTHQYRKQVLPNYGVFDEQRYFSPGDSPCIVNLNGIQAAITICEDIWQPFPCQQACDAGAELVLNLNASPYHAEKLSQRREILHTRQAETGLAMVYLNLVGGQDELVFDGGSMMLDSRGEICWNAPQFETGLYLLDIHRDADSSISVAAADEIHHPPERLQSIYNALVLGVRDYVNKNGFNGVVIGLSGGIDSALVLSIAIDALGAGNVAAIGMPSRYTSTMSIEDAREMAALLDIQYHEISIESPFSAFLDVLDPLFAELHQGESDSDTTEENIQSRCRGILLMAVSNRTGRMVLATGNKSEIAVGYATLYGDMAGGFAPLKDVPKTLVYALAEWRNRQGRIIPQRIIDRPPSAELKPDQRDVDSLPPYDILDPILERYIERDQSPDEIMAAGYDPATVQKVVRMVDRNEYKRRQAAPGVRISERAFGRDRRYPITSGYDERE